MSSETKSSEKPSFIKKYHSAEACPDSNGFNTERSRETGVSLKPKSRVIYELLIDKTPSDPNTILTAMYKAERITQKTGQTITVFTLDQQLYKIVLDVIWSDTLRWNHMIPRLRGVHWLISFMGCTGALMENSGLVPWLECASAGISKMLAGKNFPINVRALRFIVLELLRGFVDDVTSFGELQEKLDKISQEKILAEHWVRNLIRPVFLMMFFIHAERGGELPLHLYACQNMIQYFFAAGHRLCYLSKLSPNILDNFLKEQHVLRHKQGIWNGIWSDIMIETMFLKFGKGSTGIIGKTTNPRTIQIWVKNQHEWSEVNFR